MTNECKTQDMLKIAEFPKADLHVHFEGCVSYSTLIDLSLKQGISLYDSVLIGNRYMKIPHNFDFSARVYSNFRDFAIRYIKTVELIKTKDDIISIGLSYLKEIKNDSIVASHFYFTPSTLISMDRKLEPIFEGLSEIERISRKEFSHEILWAFDIVRNHYSEVSPDLTLKAAIEARKNGVSVTAIGLSGYERSQNAKFFSPVFKKASSLGFDLLAHSGETTCPKYIIDTINELNPSRIGHGISAVNNKDCITLLRNNKIIVEVCPWSNICLSVKSVANHPIKDMLRNNLDIVIASDDPGIFGKSLVDNYIYAYQAGISLEELETIARRSLVSISYIPI